MLRLTKAVSISAPTSAARWRASSTSLALSGVSFLSILQLAHDATGEQVREVLLAACYRAKHLRKVVAEASAFPELA